MEKYSNIERKLGEFTKKYYLNRIVKGIIFNILLLVIVTIALLILESYFYLSIYRKKLLLIIYFIIILVSLIMNLVIPLFGYMGIKGKLSYRKINKIIVEHFPDIKDNLLNLIELKNDIILNKQYSEDLIRASIDQKINKLSIFNFNLAINIKKNFKYLIYLFLVLIVSFGYYLVDREEIDNSSKRLISFNTEFEKPSPYTFILDEKELYIGKGDDITINLKIKSKELINQCHIIYGGNDFLMIGDSINVFKYKFSNLNNNITFFFKINQVESKNYRIIILEKPLIHSFTTDIVSPEYTNIKGQRYDNLSQMVIPSGSNCRFTFNTYETDSVFISRNGSIEYLSKEKNSFTYSARFFDNEELLLSIKNANFLFRDIIKLNIEVLKDNYPTISVNMLMDSTKLTTIYFKGLIGDDYGFNYLAFITKIDDKIDSTIKLSFYPNTLQQNFFYAYDFSAYKSTAKKVVYYFEVADNDQLNSYKKSISEQFVFQFPDIKEIIDEQDKEFISIEKLFNESNFLSNKIKEEIELLQKKMINSELSEWEKREAIKNIVQNKEKLTNRLNEIKEKNEQLNNFLQSYSESGEEIISKQQQIQELLEQVFSEDLKKLMEEFNEMLEKFDQNKLNLLKEKMSYSLDDLEKQLDKNLELLKKLQIEKKLELIKTDLNKLLEEHNNSLKKLEEENLIEIAEEMQTKLRKDIEKVEEEYSNVQKMNEKLDEEINMLDFNKEFQNIKSEFENSISNLKSKKKKAGSESMKKNKSNLKNLSFMMEQMMDAAFSEKNVESLENLLQILNNLLILSFDQEEIINLPSNEFFTNKVMNRQKRIKDNFQIIQDSIYALSKREPTITSVVNKEIVTIQTHIAIVENELREGNSSLVKANQQVVLTSVNNLSLFLSEIIKQMQKQMANSMSGNQNCQNPGNNPNPNSMGSLKKMQQNMQKQLENLMKMMKEGKGGKQYNNELGKTLGQHEMMQNMLDQLMNEGNVGSKSYETLKMAEQLMDRIKQDLLRNNVSSETLNRQKQIMTRLLEAENAEMERDQEERRKSNTAKTQFFSNPIKYFDNPNSINNFEEQLIKDRLMLKNFYQKKFQNYIIKLDSINGIAN